MYKNFEEMFAAAKCCPKKTISIAAAAEEHILLLADAIKHNDLCNVILVDDEQKIRALASECGADISEARIVDEKDPSKQALIAVSFVSSGEADIFVKGKINTSDFLKAVLNKNVGIRSGKRLSALSCYDVPGEKKLFFITDGGMNIAPDLETKVDILKNALQILNNFGIKKPKVALLSANEKVSSDMQSSVDAAAICRMADEGLLPEAIYEGPIAFDVAMRPEAAKTKGIQSQISGDVDLFLVPNIETGNCLGKAIGYFAHGQSAVLLAGALKPAVMTSRSASVSSKLNTIALAILACK